MAIIQGNSAVESGIAAYEIPNSLKFNSADSAYLSWTPASAGNRKTWTWSGWVKRAVAGDDGLFCVDGASANDRFNLAFVSNTIYILDQQSSTNNIFLQTTAVYRDPSAWYHIVLAVDTTQATSSNRLKLYVNGVQITVFSTSTYPSQNYDT